MPVAAEGEWLLPGGNTLLFKGGRRLLKMMETLLKNDYAFSNVVVKFCETFATSNL
jgi:hypothetical protein